MTSNKIKLGLVGCGHIMCAHFQGYKELLEKGVNNWEIKALCGRKLAS